MLRMTMPHVGKLPRLALVPALLASLAGPGGLGLRAAGVAYAEAPAALSAQAAPQAQENPRVGVGPFARGQMVALRGTQHQWVADDQGTLHWYSDETALANRTVDRAQRTEVTVEQLVTLPRGEPWLSLPLVNLGGNIYVPRRPSAGAAPQLAKVQSPVDLQLIGVESDNYTRVVLDRAAWERASGTNPDPLTKVDLPAIAPAGASLSGGLAPGAWAPFTSRAGGFGVWAPSQSLPAPVQVQPGTAPLGGLAGEAGVPSDIHIVTFGGYYDGPGTLFFAGSTTLPEEVLQQVRMLGPDGVFETIRAEALRSEQINLLAYRSITQGTNRGREFSFQPKAPENDPFVGVPDAQGNPLTRIVPSVTVTARVFFVGDKLFLAGVVTTPAAPPTGAQAASTDVARFLDSFKFLPPQV